MQTNDEIIFMKKCVHTIEITCQNPNAIDTDVMCEIFVEENTNNNAASIIMSAATPKNFAQLPGPHSEHLFLNL